MSESQPLFMMAAALLASGALLLPSAGYALWRLLHRQSVDILRVFRVIKPNLLIFALPILLLLGFWFSRMPGLAWLLLPLMHVLAVGLSVLWLLYIAIRNLPLGSPQRFWGVFGSGLVLGPMLILIIEGIAVVVSVLIAIMIITSQPKLLQELSSLLQWMSAMNPTQEMLSARISPYLQHPGVVFSVVAFGAVIVPLIEEALKPIGVWLLVGRDLSPADGYVAGALCGAGYALFESLAITSGGEEWAALVVARAGTAVVHILTAALTGWALASAWSGKHYLRLGLTYLTAVLLHGIWNGSTLLAAFSTQVAGVDLQASSAWLRNMGTAAPYGLVILAIGAFITLWWSNKAFRLAKPEGDQSKLIEEPHLPMGEDGSLEKQNLNEDLVIHDDGIDQEPD